MVDTIKNNTGNPIITLNTWKGYSIEEKYNFITQKYPELAEMCKTEAYKQEFMKRLEDGTIYFKNDHITNAPGNPYGENGGYRDGYRSKDINKLVDIIKNNVDKSGGIKTQGDADEPATADTVNIQNKQDAIITSLKNFSDEFKSLISEFPNFEYKLRQIIGKAEDFRIEGENLYITADGKTKVTSIAELKDKTLLVAWAETPRGISANYLVEKYPEIRNMCKNLEYREELLSLLKFGRLKYDGSDNIGIWNGRSYDNVSVSEFVNNIKNGVYKHKPNPYPETSLDKKLEMKMEMDIDTWRLYSTEAKYDYIIQTNPELVWYCNNNSEFKNALTQLIADGAIYCNGDHISYSCNPAEHPFGIHANGSTKKMVTTADIYDIVQYTIKEGSLPQIKDIHSRITRTYWKQSSVSYRYRYITQKHSLGNIVNSNPEYQKVFVDLIENGTLYCRGRDIYYCEDPINHPYGEGASSDTNYKVSPKDIEGILAFKIETGTIPKTTELSDIGNKNPLFWEGKTDYTQFSYNRLKDKLKAVGINPDWFRNFYPNFDQNMINFLDSVGDNYTIKNTYPEPTIEWTERLDSSDSDVVHNKTITEFLSDLGKSN